MTTEYERMNGHEKFKELAALANSDTLTIGERAELKGHLQICEECRETFHQYVVLAAEGIPLLAATYAGPQEQERDSWEDAATREKLFARVQAAEHQASGGPTGQLTVAGQLHFLRRVSVNPLGRAALAACLVVAVGGAGYRWGSRRELTAKQAEISSQDHLRKLATENKSVDALFESQTKKLTLLQQETLEKEQELAKLRSAMSTLEQHANEIAATGSRMEEQLRLVSQERETLSAQLRDAERAYQNVQTDLVSLRAERDKALLQSASFESKIDELAAMNREQERKLGDNAQYLASDRDIRELMGARKLYIADVFDVDSSSRTRKPFGRVFYTQGKSLIFYAFDLDRQPGLKNASVFQAWGRKESDQGKPLNLGILYMDNEANRRWVMRCDDPRQLAEIDAVFVTVEPHSGSDRPAGKPLLYASLRKEVNHP